MKIMKLVTMRKDNETKEISERCKIGILPFICFLGKKRKN